MIHYSPYWDWQAGDHLRLLPGSDATLLAGMYQDRNSDYGVVASCFEGRVIFQTFCNHDYDQTDIQLLWENYIYNTLKNRFTVRPSRRIAVFQSIVALIEKARRHAQSLFELDPDLQGVEYQTLAATLERFWGGGKGDIS